MLYVDSFEDSQFT